MSAINEQHQTSEVLAARSRAACLCEFEELPDDTLVLPPVAGAALNRSLRWLELKRHTGGGPEYVVFGGKFVRNRFGDVQRFGGRVAYRKSALLAYLATLQSFTSTSEYLPEQVAA